jgi:pimeloyl-ACP methyl ester carboxylesterase
MVKAGDAILIPTADGRTLAVSSAGPVSGSPVLFHHGWPGCRLLPPGFEEAVVERGVRLVSFDRAGYGGSSPQPGRRFAAAAADAACVADALGIGRFGTWGISGGGPHALACAALLADRVTAVVSVSGFAPFGTPGLDFTAGMGESSRREFTVAVAGREAYGPFVRAAVDHPEDALDGLLSEPDLALASREDQASYLRDSAEEALRPGIDGWLDDGLATVSPWGFELADIARPVLLLQGVHDLMVPPGHAAVLASLIPRSRLVVEPDEGHLTLCFEAGRPLDFLLEAAAERA